ncbi:MAG: hypothetical protein ACR2G4_06155 [Pyrinomonadaceae bacterium]
MKELRDSLTQLIAMIMIMITFAISTAALSQWAGSESSTTSENDSSSSSQQSKPDAPSLSASVAR